MVSLTSTQRTLWLFIADYIDKKGFAPSYGEMATAVGVRSKSGIFKLMNALEERGWIRRSRNHARAIEWDAAA